MSEQPLSQRLTGLRSSQPLGKLGTEVLRWLCFCIALWAAIRPALVTTIAADDFINPFSQLYRSGASLPTVIRKSAGSVTSNGHFNYLGQAVGSAAQFIWLYLIGKVGIPYGTVYALTKYVVYMILLLLVAELLRRLAVLGDFALSRWRSRIVSLVAIVGLIQIHIPWSNDPVASYPLAGFFTVCVGLVFILCAIRATDSWSWTWIIVSGLLGVAAVLYYEFNLFAVLAIAPLLMVKHIAMRRDARSLSLRTLKSVVICAPAALTVVMLYLRNHKFSANYQGTAVAMNSSFLRATRNGLVSSLPGSSWQRANRWLVGKPSLLWFSLFLVAVSAICLVIVLVLEDHKRQEPTEGSAEKWIEFWSIVAGLVLYWIGATITQTSTEKIQREAAGIGQVYNYYAVGATVVGVLAGALFAWFWSRSWRTTALSVSILVALSAVCTYQHQVNSQVTRQFNRVLAPNANLLNVFNEVRDNTQRCQALAWWKSLGWPEYYENDMEKGLDLAYLMYHRVEFCKN